ncbi:MAG: hypothetical protein K2J11_00180 [Oscillospiraceae bacterium]|nr:hypothetical protein [Oscillospiraceae bacterium]
MNEKFLSRGKREDTEKWVEGYYVELPEDQHGKKLHLIIGLDGQYNRIIPETVGQYTGKELHGEKLFVGDIVEDYEDYDDKWGYPATNYARSVIIWDEENFCYAFNTDGYIQPFSDWEWETTTKIGNIHDNKQMLSRADMPISNDVFQPVLQPATPENFEISPA